MSTCLNYSPKEYDKNYCTVKASLFHIIRDSLVNLKNRIIPAHLTAALAHQLPKMGGTSKEVAKIDLCVWVNG